MSWKFIILDFIPSFLPQCQNLNVLYGHFAVDIYAVIMSLLVSWYIIIQFISELNLAANLVVPSACLQFMV